jgi:hypothetical protein
MMKKKIVCLAVLLMGFVVVNGLFATAADDYKVIKNAVKSTETSRTGQKSVQWFKTLVEMMLNSCPDKKFNFDHDCEIDMKRVWNDLKAAGPLALVEVEDHGETVKIWLE